MALKIRNPRASPPTVADPTTRYAKGVCSGLIVAGPYVRDACARHLRDLEHGARRGLVWDVAETQRSFGFYRDILRLNGGEFEGKPFILHESQEFIIGSLFGWKRADGPRRFRVAFIDEGKGNGKLPLVAGIGLQGLVGDGEPRAEIYAAATKKDQAQILFRDAVAMVEQSPDLDKALVRSCGKGHEWNIADLTTASFFRTVSSDDAQSGPRPHIALLDEVHEHRTGLMVEMMRAGTKGRRQAMIVMITNSGTDRQSVCWQYHEYARKVAAGVLEDDGFFGYVCALDTERTEILGMDASCRHMQKSCTCNAQNILIDQCSRGGYAPAATQSISAGKDTRPVIDARNTRLERFLLEACATAATERGFVPSIPNSEGKHSRDRSGGPRPTEIKLGPPMKDGERATAPNTLSGGAFRSEASPAPNLTLCRPSKEALAAFVEGTESLSTLITAMIPDGFADYSASSAIRDSACLATVSKLYKTHSDTCEVRRHSLNDGQLSWRFPADDPFKDEACWVKANPLLGVAIQPRYLREQITEAEGMPSKESTVRRLNFCQWVESLNPWLSTEIWLKAQDEKFDPALLEGRKCHGGLDLGSTTDLTSFVLLFEPTAIDPHWRQKSWFWLPADNLAEKERKDGVHYGAWRAAGYLETTPGAAVNKTFVLARIVNACARYQVQSIGFDDWRIEDLKSLMEEEGAQLPLANFRQGFKSFAPAVDEYERMLVSGELKHDGNAVMNWNAASAVLDTDPAGNRKPTKAKSTGRIDGVVAAVMAAGRAIATEEKEVTPSLFFV